MAYTTLPTGWVHGWLRPLYNWLIGLVALKQSRHVRYENAIAAELITLVADASIANGAQIVAAQPTVPCKLQLRITDANSSITAGTVTFVGKDQNGDTATQTIDISNGGSHTYTTAKAYASITSITVAGLAGAAAADHISVGQSTALGLPTGTNFGGFAVYKETVNEAAEAVGTVDATAGTVIPTTAPDGAKDFDFWYSYHL